MPADKDSDIGAITAIGPFAAPPPTKYERLLARAKEVPAASTIVVYPCDETSLRGPIEAAQAGIIVPILVGPAPRISAVAREKSAAEFLLKTCLPAMDDLSNVEVMARDGNWIPRRIPLNSAALSRFSMWDVAQDEDNKFTVNVWISHLGELDFNTCSVLFFSKDANRGDFWFSKNVNRDEFFNILSASLELIFMSETRFPQMRGETYQIKNDRPKMLVLGIQSQLDGSVTMSSIAEQRRYRISPAAPPTPSQIGR